MEQDWTQKSYPLESIQRAVDHIRNPKNTGNIPGIYVEYTDMFVPIEEYKNDNGMDRRKRKTPRV
jgi:hypothetical protein